MTNKELSQLYWLNREIESDKERLAQLEAAAVSTTSRITGLPHVGGISDKTSLVTDIDRLREKIQLKIKRSVVVYEYLLDYIDSIDDSLVRQIMTYRHINGLSWQHVAMLIGGDNTSDSVRKIHDRYLREN